MFFNYCKIVLLKQHNINFPVRENLNLAHRFNGGIDAANQTEIPSREGQCDALLVQMSLAGHHYFLVEFVPSKILLG